MIEARAATPQRTPAPSGYNSTLRRGMRHFPECHDLIVPKSNPKTYWDKA